MANARLSARSGATSIVAMAAMLASSTAFAQAADEAAADDREIIVTGTLIRGEQPVGSQVIGLGEDKIEAIAPISNNELLAAIPQVTNYFNRSPTADLAIAANQIQISRPNLRNISPNNASSAATLILVDGHRVATAGVNQASVDPDLIPSGAIQRVEVATEGGSATYGADAVAGVINFITRKRFDGVEVGGHYGFADDYWQWDANATIGKDWGSGSIFATYSYSKSDHLFGRERDFIRELNYATQPYVGLDTECVNPNLSLVTSVFGNTVGSVLYAAPAFTPNTRNTCDGSDNNTYLPKAERHGALVGLTQDLSDRTSISLRAYYSERTTRSSAEVTGSVPIGPGNPAAASLPAGLAVGPTFVTIPPFGTLPATNTASVSFSLNPLLGDFVGGSTIGIEQYGANIELEHDISDDWQVRGLLNWSQSDSGYGLRGLNQERLNAAGNGTTAATAFNPFNLAGNNPALIADLIDNEIAGQARDELFNARLLAEGRLFTLGGGDVRLAFGYEFINDTLRQRFSSAVRVGGLSALPFTKYSRNVNAVFGELRLPLISDGNGGSMLTLSAAGRYDDYSDFGSTFNPKLGVTFKPVEWATLRGNWGTSFTAPTPLDQLGSLRNTISSFPFVAFTRPGETPLANSITIAVQGSLPGLQPQEAETWSVGADIEPVDGLKLSATYYDVLFENILRTPFSNTPYTDYPANYLTSIPGFNAQQIRDFSGGTPGTEALITSVAGRVVYSLVDFRTGNFGVLKVAGLDLSANYRADTGFGGFDLGVSANLPLRRKAQISPTSPVVDELDTENSKLFLQATAGVDIGGLRAQATVNHNGGYDIVPTTGTPVQDRVKSFTTANLYFAYDVPVESGLLSGLSFSLNVNNLFDEEPPVLLRNNQGELGFANGFSVGRTIILGLSKKF